MSATEWTLTGRLIFPVAQAPLERGVITIQGEQIIGIDPSDGRGADVDLGNVAIIPGLVNAHTHLDLSGLLGQVPTSSDFTGWLRQIVAARRAMSAEAAKAAIAAGLAEALRFGTTLIGDIAAGGATWDALVDAPTWAVVYHELLGLPQDRAQQALADGIIWVVMHPETATCRPGLSPHAPYSVRMSLFRKIADLAREAPIPIASHIGETTDEIALLSQQQGPFVPFLRELGVYDPAGLVPTHAELLAMFRGIPHFAIAHGNYLEMCLPADELRPFTRVYCPRTHSAFGHAPYPLHADGRFALGTDSLASNPDLDVFAEAHWVAQRYPQFPRERILEMVTQNGAEILGFGDRTGTLELGKSADLVALPLPDVGCNDAYALLFHPSWNPSAPRRTLWRGEWRNDQ